MTEGESLALNDANEFIRQTANLLDEAEQSTGIRPHPIIEESETVLETTRFGLQYGPEPEAEVTDSASGEGGDCGGCVCIDTAVISSAGTGFTQGQALLPGGGTICPPATNFPFKLYVLHVDGSGGVTDFVIYPLLGYLSPPSNPISLGGGGTGFSADCTFACTPVTKPMPASISIEFTGVTFDCGCIDNNNGTSRIVNDSSFNDNPHTWTKIGSCGGGAAWNTSSHYPVSLNYYASSSDCTGTDSGDIFNPTVIFFLKDGVYRLIAFELTGITAERPSIIFDGTTTDLSVPISNTVSCGTVGVAHGGTATVTIL